MRILFVTNFFPPNFIGGYELGCSRVVSELKSRGHVCHVLTSRYSASSRAPEVTPDLRFWLRGRQPQRMGGMCAAIDDQINRRVVKRTIEKFMPDVIHVWNPMCLSPGILDEAARANVPTAFFVSDEWPAIWQTSQDRSSWRLNQALQVAHVRWAYDAMSTIFGTGNGQYELGFGCVQFASEYLLRKITDSGIAIESARVVRWGVDRERYLCSRTWERPARRFLYVGQLSRHKGIHVGLEAFVSAARTNSDLNLELSIAGEARDLEYKRELEEIANCGTYEGQIHWLGKLDEAQLRKAYQTHDAFLFTSSWNEPFSIALVEAMSAGMAVVSTLTGGTSELVEDELNGLVFRTDDPIDCERQILRLATGRALCERLSYAALASTCDLTLQRMCQDLESELQKASSCSRSTAALRLT